MSSQTNDNSYTDKLRSQHHAESEFLALEYTKKKRSKSTPPSQKQVVQNPTSLTVKNLLSSTSQTNCSTMTNSAEKIELELWVANLTQNVANLETWLNADHANPVNISVATDEVIESCAAIELFKPTKEVDYDYNAIVPKLFSAKLLVNRAKRFNKTRVESEMKPIETSCRRRIPEMEIPRFDGDITQYRSFIEAFKLKYDELPISPRERLQHLKQNTTGNPLRLIERFELTDVNYALALQKLDDMYRDEDETISALYSRMEKLPTSSSNISMLQNTYLELESIIAALESHGQRLNAFPPLRDKIYGKYPSFLIHQVCGTEKLDIKEFQVAIGRHIKMRANIQATQAANVTITGAKNATTAALTSASGKPKRTEASSPKNNEGAKQKSTEQNEPTKVSRRTPTCVFCDLKHYSAECSTYTTIAVRKQRLIGRCHLCLSKQHGTEQCTKVVYCYYCKAAQAHHSCICPQKFTDMSASSSKSAQPPPASNVPATNTVRSTNFMQRSSGAHCTALLTVVNPVTERTFLIRTLLDNGSNQTYIDENAARRIGLQLSTFQRVPVNVFHHTTPITLKTATTAFAITNGNDFCIDVIADTAPQLPQSVKLFDIEDFRVTHPEFNATRFVEQGDGLKIELLLGSDYFYDLIKPEQRETVEDGLHLFGTPFGMILVGRKPEQSTQQSLLYQLSPTKAIEALCDLDGIGIRELPVSAVIEEERALEQFYDSIRFENNRYQIRLPWRDFPPPLKDNFGLAAGRLKALLRKFDGPLFDAYRAIIDTQIQAGIVKEISAKQATQQPRFFLPHHAVFTPEKSTPLRIVFDGSARVQKQPSINDAIYKGTNLLTKGCAIQIRFRLRPVVTASDIEKAFHQLVADPVDRPFLMFMFVHDRSKAVSGSNLRFLQFTRFVFGIVASPFVLQATVRYHLRTNPAPFTAQIEKDIYVDGIITGFRKRDDAEQFYASSIELFQRCSMNLRKWASNDPELRLKFEQPDRSASISILGINWDQYDDVLKLKPITVSNDDTPTLRIVLSTTAQLYDPCGYVAPITIVAKIFIRELHADYGWDDPLSAPHQLRWSAILAELRRATEIVLPRFQYDIEEENAEYEIHVFADASEKACACAVYLVRKTATSISAQLVFARTKLAKLSDIPKLELIAAYLAAKALLFVTGVVQRKIERQTLWSDSSCVIAWILNTARILPAFIQRRVEDIRNVPNLTIRYIAGTENPADMPSRGVGVSHLRESEWFTGPIKWISGPTVPPPGPETPIAEIYFSNVPLPEVEYPFTIDPTQFMQRRNAYLVLLRVTMEAMKFINNFTIARRMEHFTLKPSLYAAHLLWIKYEQRNHYREIFVAIEQRKSNMLVKRLNLFIDKQGILRCAGRFHFAPQDEKERQPILLPSARRSRFVQLLIRYYHESAFHVGTGYTLAAIRRRYWLPAARHSVFNEIKKCKNCIRYTARPYRQPDESALPAFRLDDKSTPFQNIGIDTFGPLMTEGKKRYALIVTDLVIRAIELELLEDMTAECIYLALRRIIARRGTPSLIVSDNAPQFVAIKQSFEATGTHEFVWKFILEHASWMAGIYERLIGIVKQALFRTFHHNSLKENALRTALAEIAGTLNNRPLTYVGADETEEVITPNHFLKTYFVEENGPQAVLDRYWKHAYETSNQFWKIWRTIYLQWLRNHYAAVDNRRSTTQLPAVGDMVIIINKTQKRNHWPLAYIEQLLVSDDGQVRGAQVRTKTGSVNRPISELCPLETNIKLDANPENPPNAIGYVPDMPISEAEDWIDPEIDVEIIDNDSDESVNNANQTEDMDPADDWFRPIVEETIVDDDDDEVAQERFV